MYKTINERLFELLMRAPHAIRKTAIEVHFGKEVPEKPQGHEHHGHGHGPGDYRRHKHDPEGFHIHGPKHGHGRRTNPAFSRERVLEVIGGYEDGVRQKSLTEELGINPSSVSEMISKLEGDGYVRRTIDPTDKRATLITLTELGEARAAEFSDERNEGLDAAFRALTDSEKEQLIALLEKITDNK